MKPVKNIWIRGLLKDLFELFQGDELFRNQPGTNLGCSNFAHLEADKFWKNHIPSDGKDPVPPRIYKTLKNCGIKLASLLQPPDFWTIKCSSFAMKLFVQLKV